MIWFLPVIASAIWTYAKKNPRVIAQITYSAKRNYDRLTPAQKSDINKKIVWLGVRAAEIGIDAAASTAGDYVFNLTGSDSLAAAAKKAVRMGAKTLLEAIESD